MSPITQPPLSQDSFPYNNFDYNPITSIENFNCNESDAMMSCTTKTPIPQQHNTTNIKTLLDYLVVGVGQGAIIALATSMPRVVEAALATRAVLALPDIVDLRGVCMTARPLGGQGLG